MRESLTFYTLEQRLPKSGQLVWLLRSSGEIVPAQYNEGYQYGSESMKAYYAMLDAEFTHQGSWAPMELPLNANTSDG